MNASAKTQANLGQVKAMAKKFGAAVEDDKSSHTHECRVCAPYRHVWKCSGVHELVDSTNVPWKPDYADLLSRMSYGIAACTDPECEWCADDDNA